ncbi:hypothetical protein GUITHDRAFT_133512 [Guillardia theta CCMP2712]|uniref:Uncharacterized protein n=1 Tax=Guillardia theta (strain CCMP2712) TaxID=905079 RepID=L1JWE8_GUITC|nr:hypothetical protein GUITHDRAFT_133512 [Guillardia theta CCMP2712]EKX52418.1 hypothetical protein GUITHDRAFT_133512 [Guillardia theta CCMP2712]|eukprot:XP_005839398.1 hypothetical protein GUITHDRAFT_133512 [Guillardia theta CCMP2712]
MALTLLPSSLLPAPAADLQVMEIPIEQMVSCISSMRSARQGKDAAAAKPGSAISLRPPTSATGGNVLGPSYRHVKCGRGDGVIITSSLSAGREHRMRASINVPTSSIQLTPRRARTAASAERESFVQQWTLGHDNADRDSLLPPAPPLSNDVLSAQSCTHRKYLFVRDTATAGTDDPQLTSRSLLVVRRKNSLLGSGIVPRNPLFLMEIGRHMEEDGTSARAGSFPTFTAIVCLRPSSSARQG